ncbi:MAG: hypothetical protein ACI4FZ_06460 [Lachnospiraceae bacterium]
MKMKRGIRAVFGIVMSIILMLDMVPLPAFAEAEKTYINATEAVENPADYLFASQKDGTTKALFIDGAETAVEVSEEELTGIELWVQNANVTAPVTIGVRNFEISGNGSINTGAVVITPSNTIGSIISTTSTGSALTVVEHFTSEQFKGSEDSLGAVYSYEMIDNFEFSGWLAADSLSVAAGKKLTLNAFVEADSVIIDGELFIGASEDPEYPNGLNIKDGGSLEVKAGGSLTVEDGQILDICGGSTVTGITLYDCDGETAYNNFEFRETFCYDAERTRWVRQNPGGGENPEGIPDNRYVVRYDANNGAAVTVNDVSVNDGEEYEFAQGDALNITLTPPEDCQDPAPVVAIKVGGENEGYYSTNLADDDPYKLSLVNNTVSFTPNSDAGIEVLVWWTEYDAFGGNEEKPVIVEFECFGNGTVTPENIANEDMIVYEQWTKVRVSADTESVTIRWEEGTTPSEIRAEGDLTLSAGDFLNNTCTIPLTPTMDHYYIRVDFGGNQGGENPGGISDNCYVVRYDSNNDAAVNVNGNSVENNAEQVFTKGTELTFTLTPPEHRKNATPVVSIRIDGENEEYRTDYPDDNPNKLSLAGNTVSFTPESDTGFWVEIWWSAYDAFDRNEEKPIIVEFECLGNGTITPEDIAGEDKFVYEQWTKVRVSEETESVTIRWEEGNAPNEIRAGGDQNFSAADFVNNTCTIPLTQTNDDGSKKNFYCIQVDFGGNQGGDPGENPGGISDNHYEVRYDSGDNNDASVTVNGRYVADSEEQEFTEETELIFALTPPEHRKNATPVVSIRIDGENEEYRTDYPDDNPNKLSLVGNTVSFTPKSTAGFRVEIWWSEYDAFGGNEDKPVIVEFNCIGDGTITPEGIDEEDKSVDDDGQSMKVRVSKGTESITISWEEGSAPGEIRVEGGQTISADKFVNNTCSIPLPQTNEDENYYRIQVEFDNGEEPEPPTDELIDEAIGAVEEHEYAYYVDLQQPDTAVDSLKEYFTTELWWEFFGKVNGGNKRPYYGMFDNTFSTVSDALMNAVTLESGSGNDSTTGLPYYTYTITFSESKSATGKIYLLNGAKEFVVKTGNKYQVVDTSAMSRENMDIYVSGNGEVSIFGNGTCAIGRLESGDSAIWAAHISQEHSGLGDDPAIGDISCRLAVLPENYSGAKITGGVSAAAWGFASVPLFSAGTAGAASYAEIYYGNDGSDESRNLTISTIVDSRGINPYGNKAITNVALDTRYISDAVAEINPVENDFVLSFRSAYDEIPLVITYSDGSKGYVTIRRVGLHLSDTSVQNGTYDIWHGTDNIQNYSMDGTDEKAVTAAFYYATGDQMPEDTDRVSLSVTVTMTDGTVKCKMISAERRLNDTPIRTTGEDKYCDDFLVWSGTESEYDALDKIEVFAFVAGDSDSFGGVKVGSGAGVEWKPEE